MRYLTSAGHAIAERQRWQNRVAEEMLFILERDEGKRWGTIVRAMVSEMNGLPPFAREFLMRAEPDDPFESYEQLARTLGTAGYNTHVLVNLAAEGIPFKQWQTRRDDRVRDTHVEADRQKVPLGRPFIVGGMPLQYPADPKTASPDLWMGCRCVILGKRS